MTREGKLKAETEVLIWKDYLDIPGNTRYVKSPPGSAVLWEGATNEGHEEYYGNRKLLWSHVWNEEMQGWFSVGLEEEEVEWDEEVRTEH